MKLIKPAAVLLAIAIISSCTRTSETSPVIENENRVMPISKIQSDPVFIQLVKDQINFYAGIRNPAKIKEVMADGQITPQEYQSYPSYFGYSSTTKFESYFLDLKKRAGYLDATYNFKKLTREEKKAILTEGIKNARARSGNPELSLTDDGPCETIRLNCIAAVSAETVIMHLTCAALDVTIFLGIVCHSAATVYQITAGNNCNANYQLCKNGSVQ